MTQALSTTVLNSICSRQKINESTAAELDYEFFKNFPSEHTQKSYRNDIGQFLDFIRDNFSEVANIDTLKRVHVVAFRNWLQELDYAPKTINRKLSSTSSYIDFLIEKGFIDFNPFNSVKRPKQVVVNETNDLSDEEVVKLFEAVDVKSKSGPLHQAIIYMLFSTGIRKSELINLKLKDYTEINGHKVIKIKAKGGKRLTKVVPPESAEVLDSYVRWLHSQSDEMHPEDWLFRPTRNPQNPGQLNRPLNPKSIDYIIKVHAKKAGITHRISPHSARASYIGSALQNGVDLLIVSQDVGHASVDTTQEYNKRRTKLNEGPAYKLGFFNERK
ncbi:MAG: tyrosine-type recombinase/integrase [Bacteriovoracaceae bacterium]|nr:tyrosine-type recombinase/integrase [Bacteriovoracaceae bacterium]